MQKIVTFLAAISLSQFPGCEKENEYVAPPPPAVSVAEPVQRDVTEYLEFTGSTVASAFVEVRARVPGYLQRRHFTPGDIVQQGQLLFEIDPSEYEANLQAALADLKVAEAELAQATTELERSERLQKKGAVAEVKVVEWRTKQSTALAAKQQAQAKVDRAELDLTYVSIEAPIHGRISRNLVDPGNLVGEGEATLLATITAFDPMHAYFNLNELDLLRVMNMARETEQKDALDLGELPEDYKPVIPLYLGLADEEGYPHEGVVDYGESGLDPETGTLRLRGVFDNPGRRPMLIPGLFARLRMPVQIREDALLVTERALGADQSGRFVLVVDSENQVEKRNLRTGQNIDGLLVIEEGLRPGERVIVRGMQRARPSAPVDPQVVDMEAFATSALRAAAEAETESEDAAADTNDETAEPDAATEAASASEDSATEAASE
jgi:RND family efflux transporter MFP subunit